MISVTIPIWLKSSSNLREHWSARMRRNKSHKMLAQAELRSHFIDRPPSKKDRFIVTLTRIAPRMLDDDNLAAAFKGVRDGVAKAMGIDDRQSPLLKWVYEQEKGEPKYYAIRIEVRAKRFY